MKYGRALVDAFVMSCRQWIDEDAPIKYQFGVEDAGGLTWFKPSQRSGKSFKLPQGQILIKVQVIDSLGERSPIQSSDLTVTTSRRRRQLLQISQDSNEDMFNNTIEEVQRELHLGNTANVLQQSESIASEMDVRSFVSPEKCQLLLSCVDNATVSSARTIAFAESAVAVSAALQQYSFQVTATSIATAAKIIDNMAHLVSGFVTPSSFANHINLIISAATGALVEGACNGGYVTLPAPIPWMKLTRSASFLAMKSSIHEHMPGEPVLMFSRDYSKIYSRRLTADSLQGDNYIGDTWVEIGSDVFNVYASTSIDVIISQNRIISSFLANLISDVFSAVVISPKDGLTQVASTTKPINVTIPVNIGRAISASLAAAAVSQNLG